MTMWKKLTNTTHTPTIYVNRNEMIISSSLFFTFFSSKKNVCFVVKWFKNTDDKDLWRNKYCCKKIWIFFRFDYESIMRSSDKRCYASLFESRIKILLSESHHHQLFHHYEIFEKFPDCTPSDNDHTHLTSPHLHHHHLNLSRQIKESEEKNNEKRKFIVWSMNLLLLLLSGLMMMMNIKSLLNHQTDSISFERVIHIKHNS